MNLLYPILLSCCTMLQPSQAQVAPIKIRVYPQIVTGQISPAFMGLGYETAAVAQPGFFSAKNIQMMQLYHNLSPHGLIRIGGNVSDYTKYLPNGESAARTEKEVTIINKADLEGLGKFASATGWKVMWGLNLKTGTMEEAVAEAMAVHQALGSQLQSFEIGNEVDAFPQFSRDYTAYHAAYTKYKAAIRAALPAASFSGPDVIGNWEWIRQFVHTEAGDMALLTQHYYRGWAKNPMSTLERLLEPDTAWIIRLKKLREICLDHNITYRINEVNSFSGGGKQDVSDTFGAALWCLDYMFLVASYGGEGVNIETDINQLGWISHYSPIVHDLNGNCMVKPEYYGMLAFAMASNGALLKLDLDKADINMSAYATRPDTSSFWVTVINKDFAKDADVEITLPEGYSAPGVFRLTAPSLLSKENITLAGKQVSADGHWTPGKGEKIKIKKGMVHLFLPHGSAVLLCFRRS